MDDRKQARAMDLPGFSTPPFVRDIPGHAGSWGWVSPTAVAQDDAGFLWANGTTHPRPSELKHNSGHRVLLAWSPDGLSAWVDPAGYGGLARITGDVDEAKWVPIAEVLADMPPYSEGG